MISNGGIFRVRLSYGQYVGIANMASATLELEEMMSERGIDVDHSTIYRWVQHYAPELHKRLIAL
jgi:transposase-like protein